MKPSIQTMTLILYLYTSKGRYNGNALGGGQKQNKQNRNGVCTKKRVLAEKTREKNGREKRVCTRKRVL